MNPPQKKGHQRHGQPDKPPSRPKNDHLAEEVAALVMCAKTGDQRAMGQLYRIHRPMVQALVRHFTAGRPETEDLIQDSFLRAFRNLTSFRADKASFRTWLYRITSNCCLDYVRRRKTRRTHMEAFYLADKERGSKLAESPEARADLDQRRHILRSAVTLLPAKQRMALVLKHFNGIPIREIARIMNCTEGTVKRHLYRAVRRLRREIDTDKPGDTHEV